MNAPVSFEIAKLLKEKGAYLSSEKRYNKKGTFEYSKSWSVAAPTIAEVVMWIYKNHEMWIYVHKDGGWWFPVIENYYDENDQGTIIEDLSKMTRTYFNSPEEAYEAAIEYTLNNLI